MTNKKHLSELSGKEYEERLKEIEKHNEEWVDNQSRGLPGGDNESGDNEKGVWEEIKELLFQITGMLFLLYCGFILVPKFYDFVDRVDNPFLNILTFILSFLFLILLYFVIRTNADIALRASLIEDESYRQPRRKPIKQKIKDQVWNRDGGRCVNCGSNKNIEFDHIVPWSKGGADTYRNLQILCETCNRSKGADI